MQVGSLTTLTEQPGSQHDARRTVHLAGHGGRGTQGHLRWVTHGPEGDIVDLYTTLPCHTL
jgi:hypothetical protein